MLSRRGFRTCPRCRTVCFKVIYIYIYIHTHIYIYTYRDRYINVVFIELFSVIGITVMITMIIVWLLL